MRTALAIVACVVALAPAVARAHPLALGVLVVHEAPDGSLESRFRFSGTEASPTGAEVVWPRRCRALASSDRALAVGGIERRERLACGARGLEGTAIAVRGMEGSGVEILVRIERADGGSVEAVLDDTTREIALSSGDDGRGALFDHVALGVEHIALGIDHLLFVLALVLLVRGARALLLTITAFTAGHSATLALAALGAIHVPVAPVEACIALSIVLVAREALVDRAPDRPWAMAGAFGLLHGLGFAGALAELGLSRERIVPALVGFNVGVELGQIAFVAIVLAAIALGRALRVPRERARAATLLAIGSIAAYFLVDRCTMLGSAS